MVQRHWYNARIPLRQHRNNIVFRHSSLHLSNIAPFKLFYLLSSFKPQHTAHTHTHTHTHTHARTHAPKHVKDAVQATRGTKGYLTITFLETSH